MSIYHQSVGAQRAPYFDISHIEIYSKMAELSSNVGFKLLESTGE
jgi:hypothetical protein